MSNHSNFKKSPFKTIQNLAKIAGVITLIAVLASCSSDNGPNYRYVNTAITEVDLPDTTFISPQDTIQTDVSFKKPNDCFDFNGFGVDRGSEDDEYLITAQGIIYGDSCAAYDEPKIKTETFKFPGEEDVDDYSLKFLKGKDSTDNDKLEFITKKVIVEDTTSN